MKSKEEKEEKEVKEKKEEKEITEEEEITEEKEITEEEEIAEIIVRKDPDAITETTVKIAEGKEEEEEIPTIVIDH